MQELTEIIYVIFNKLLILDRSTDDKKTTEIAICDTYLATWTRKANTNEGFEDVLITSTDPKDREKKRWMSITRIRYICMPENNRFFKSEI